MNAAPRADLEQIEGVQTVILREPSTESAAHVVAELGSNLARFRTRVGDQIVEVIAAPPSMQVLRVRPTRWGKAVLFPYPGRISGGRFAFRGREIVVPPYQGGETIHGVVRQRPWRVLDHGASPADGAWVVTQIGTAAEQVPAAEWPFSFVLTLRTSLRGGVVRLESEVVNDGEEPMPMGLGFHPYFPTPLGPNGSAESCEVWVDATELWERHTEPPGEMLTLGPDRDPRRPRALADIPPRLGLGGEVARNFTYRRDTSGPSDAPGGISAGLRDPANGLEVSVTASAGFGSLVFFTPATPPVMSLEPQSCLPNAVNLAPHHQNTGLVVLEPGERWRGWFEIRCGPLR